MGLHLPTKTTLSMMGLEDDIQRLKKNISHHNVIHDHSDGTTRSIYIQIIRKLVNGTLKIKAYVGS